MLSWPASVPWVQVRTRVSARASDPAIFVTAQWHGKPNTKSLFSIFDLTLASNMLGGSFGLNAAGAPVALNRLVPKRTHAMQPSASHEAATAQPELCKPEFVRVAHELADAAAVVTNRYFRTPVPVDIKADASPVTIADREAEGAMRQLLARHFPHHSVFGEEQGYQHGSRTSTNSAAEDDGSYLWVIDPIDGTKSFITGKPLFGTLISLLHNGTPILGVIDQPYLRERWVGAAGQRSQLNGRPISTRECGDIGAAYLYATTPHMFSGANEAAFNRVRDSVRIPMYGCDCYAYGLLAAGYCDLVVEADLKPYDYMALVPVIEGAGGIITNWKGEPLRWDVRSGDDVVAYSGEVVAAGDARAHKQALQLLDWK